MPDNVTFDELIGNVTQWADEKGILKKENSSKQMLKVLEEVGETAGALLRSDDKEIEDGIGDSFVTLIILAGQLGYTPQECLLQAWNEIKNRKGKTENGIFIKDDTRG